jgi:hypothetical protein
MLFILLRIQKNIQGKNKCSVHACHSIFGSAELYFFPIPSDPSVQGGKNWRKRKLCLPWVKKGCTDFRANVVNSAWGFNLTTMATYQITGHKLRAR